MHRQDNAKKKRSRRPKDKVKDRKLEDVLEILYSKINQLFLAMIFAYSLFHILWWWCLIYGFAFIKSLNLSDAKSI